jgi:FkbM family methyltransferase
MSPPRPPTDASIAPLPAMAESRASGAPGSFLRRIVKNGCSFWVHDREPAFWDRVERGTWEPHTFTLFDRFLDPDHCCLDVGAWIGPTALYAARRARHCYALEPDPVAFARLRENVRLNPSLAARITLSPQCLAPACGQVRIGNQTSSMGGDSMSSLLFAESLIGWQAQGITLERFLAGHAIRDCSFIKMDIEGGEFSVLPAMASYLATHRPTLYLSLHPAFLPDAQQRVSAVRDALSCYGHVYAPDFRPVAVDVTCDPATFASCYELIFTDLDCA